MTDSERATKEFLEKNHLTYSVKVGDAIPVQVFTVDDDGKFKRTTEYNQIAKEFTIGLQSDKDSIYEEYFVADVDGYIFDLSKMKDTDSMEEIFKACERWLLLYELGIREDTTVKELRDKYNLKGDILAIEEVKECETGWMDTCNHFLRSNTIALLEASTGMKIDALLCVTT